MSPSMLHLPSFISPQAPFSLSFLRHRRAPELSGPSLNAARACTKRLGPPDAIKQSNAIVVGGGPVGSLTALHLALRGVPVTLIESTASFQQADYSRSYSFAIYPRAVPTLKAIPQLWETIQSHCSTPSQIVKSTCDRTLLRFPLPDVYQNSKFILRTKLMALLQKFVSDSSVCTMYGATVSEVGMNVDGSINVILRKDGVSSSLTSTFVVAADGRNSKVVAALAHGAKTGTVSSRREFQKWERISPSVGLRVKSVLLSLAAVEQVGISREDLRKSLSVLYGREEGGIRGRIGLFPTALQDIEEADGVLGVMVHEEGSGLGLLQTCEEGFGWFEEQFTQLDVRKAISTEQMQNFVDAKAGEFPPVTRVASLAGVTKNGGGVVILGDAAHHFPPDTGLGVNAGFEDVWKLMEVLDGSDTCARVADVATQYEQERDAEVSALVEIARVSSPYQYRQSNGIGAKLSFLNLAVRAQLAKTFPSGAFYEHMAFSIVRSTLAYTEVLRRSRQTTRRMALAAVLMSMIGYVCLEGLLALF